MHSCHTALSNYSTIAAAQVMEFQLKYDSFRICLCRWRRARRVEGGVGGSVGPGGEGMDHGESTGDTFVLHLSTSHSLLINPPSIKAMAYFRHFTSSRTLRLESGQKRVCFDKKSLQ